MVFTYNKTLNELDSSINEYIIYLVHIQQSVTLPITEKVNAFHAADTLAIDINAITAKIKSMNVNQFNEVDINTFINKSFGKVIKGIRDEIVFYDKKLKINDKVYFSMKEAVNLLRDPTHSDISLGLDKMNRLLSYKKLMTDIDDQKKDALLKKELDETVKKYDKQFDDIKLKTFKDLIRGVNHKNEEYFFKTNLYIIRNYLSKMIIMESFDSSINGTFFVLEKDKDIRVRVKDKTFLADYSIKTGKAGDISSLYIIGLVEHDNSKVDFYIEESFSSSMMNSYLNAFSLNAVIQKCNECYLDYYSKEISVIGEEETSKSHIDDFFSGKIE